MMMKIDRSSRSIFIIILWFMWNHFVDCNDPMVRVVLCGKLKLITYTIIIIIVPEVRPLLAVTFDFPQLFARGERTFILSFMGMCEPILEFTIVHEVSLLQYYSILAWDCGSLIIILIIIMFLFSENAWQFNNTLEIHAKA